MRVLVLEDEEHKFVLIEQELNSFYADRSLSITRAETLFAANKLIYQHAFDLIIIDLMMPPRAKELPRDITGEILPIIADSGINTGASAVALSGFTELVQEQKEAFLRAGILLVHYDAQEQEWRRSLADAFARIKDVAVFDFVIICALEKERNGFIKTRAKIGELQNIRGLDCLPIDIDGHQGVCVRLPRMGLVDATITASRSLERFRPKLICMSGICAGSEGETKIGNLVVADICWEYQAGKWAKDGFRIEHYDIQIEANARTNISHLIERDPTAADLKKDLIKDPVVFERVLFGPMATGSAVIANTEKMSHIQNQHRKMAALDMEMFGVYRAASLSATNAIYFGAKTVVDVGNENKGDTYHDYGCTLSARFICNCISNVLANQER